MPTEISWAEETWNPTLGCKRVSAGCDGCYAIRTAHRWASSPHPAVAAAYRGLTHRVGGRVDWTGQVRVLPERFEAPLRWYTPKRVFVDSMSDLGHPAIPREDLARIFATMALSARHTYLVLTKRPDHLERVLTATDFTAAVEEHATDLIGRTPQRLNRRLDLRPGWSTRPGSHGTAWAPPWPLPNVHVGVSVENQATAEARIPKLMRIPAAVRWLSIEPLVAPVALDDHLPRRHGHPDGDVDLTGRGGSPGDIGIDWVVVGGESGPAARPMHIEWVRALHAQCTRAGAAFHLKQAGVVLARQWGCTSTTGDRPDEWPERFPRDYPAAAR